MYLERLPEPNAWEGPRADKPTSFNTSVFDRAPSDLEEADCWPYLSVNPSGL